VSVGTSGAELNINSLTIVQHLIVTFNSLTLTQPDGT
jgi:hypothetical protein